jgi:SAM-dependent methyltransferase
VGTTADEGAKTATRWWDGNASRLFLCGVAALFWELVLIRWLGASIRIVAYFSNLVLISAFFGLGVGALATRFRVRLERWIAPLIALAVMLGVWMGRLWHANPGGGGDNIWIGGARGIAFEGQRTGQVFSVGLILVVVYAATAAVFVAFGQYIGRLFRTHPPLRAYSIEVGGSLVGIALFALMSHWQTSPAVWFGVGTVLLVLALPRLVPDGAVAAVLGVLVVLGTHSEVQRYLWSPYYRIHVEPITSITDPDSGQPVEFGHPVGHVLTVNNDYHQMMIDLTPRRQEHEFFSGWRTLYDAPYATYADLGSLPPGDILVVGAGTGNDVAAALRRTNRRVIAVEIDPAISALGRRLHPEHPYSDPRVTLVTGDARSFFNHSPGGRYALVVFGFLDSHRLLSVFSSVRLDNFIYTREAMAEVRRLLVPGGRVALSFAPTEVWIHERIQALLDRAFERPTLIRIDERRWAFGVVYMNMRQDAPSPIPPRRALVPTDDWPFLYLRERRIPGHNLLFIFVAVSLSAAALLILPRGERRLRLPYFFLGAAFFLLETSNVVRMALLYGSTWWVNTIVFAGILVLVLLANLTASRWHVPIGLCLALLGALILVATVLPSGVLLALSPVPRGIVAVGLFLGPVYFGGLIFARLIENEARLYEAYGSNVLGAVLGGTTEYLSLVFGFQFLLAVALLFYLLVFLLLRRSGGLGGTITASA